MINRTLATTISAMSFLAFCVANAQGTRAADEQRSDFDFRIPDITELYSHEQIQALLAPTFRESVETVIEAVEVQGRREAVTPTVWRGIAAPFWAIFNPTQAWRIIAPFPPDQSRALAFNVDVTTPYQEPAARTAADL